MQKNSFSEDDKQKFVDFLNMIAEKAEFSFKTEEVIQFYKLLAHMQQKILPKIHDNILEIKKIVDPNPEENKPSKSKSGSRGK